MKTYTLALFLVFSSITGYAQNTSGSSGNTQNDSRLVPLQNLVDKIKSENESLKSAKKVNVMVNDLLIENLQEYMINPKNISTQEVLVLNSNDVNRDNRIASIIINTRNR